MTPGDALIGARLLHYAAVLALFGAALFPLYAFPRGAPVPAAVQARLRLMLPLAAVAALVSAGIWLMFTAAAMGGDIALAVDGPTLSMTAGGTPFGRLWLLRMGLAAALALWTLWPRAYPAVTTIGAAILLASLALTGHAGAVEGATGWVQRSADALHLLAAGAWFGALGLLGFMLGRRVDDVAAAPAFIRFAGMGSAAVATLVATGLLNSWLIFEGDLGLLWTSTYGRLLAAKVGLFGVMLLLAAANRFWLAPAYGREADRAAALTKLKLTVGIEHLLAGAVLVLVSILGVLDPQA